MATSVLPDCLAPSSARGGGLEGGVTGCMPTSVLSTGTCGCEWAGPSVDLGARGLAEGSRALTSGRAGQGPGKAGGAGGEGPVLGL